MEQTFTRAEVESALCIWEELDRRSRAPSDHPTFALWRFENGVSALRDAAISLVAYCEGIYHAIPAEEWDGIAYDCELVPELLDWVSMSHVPPEPLLAITPKTARSVVKYLKGESRRGGR